MKKIAIVLLIIISLTVITFWILNKEKNDTENDLNINKNVLVKYQNSDWGYEIEYDESKISFFYDDNSEERGYAQFHYLGEAPSLNSPIFIMSEKTEYDSIEEYFDNRLKNIEDAYHNPAQIDFKQDNKFSALTYGFIPEVWASDRTEQYYIIKNNSIITTLIAAHNLFVESDLYENDLDNFLNSITFK